MAGFSRKDFRVGEVPAPAPAQNQENAEQVENFGGDGWRIFMMSFA